MISGILVMSSKDVRARATRPSGGEDPRRVAPDHEGITVLADALADGDLFEGEPFAQEVEG